MVVPRVMALEETTHDVLEIMNGSGHITLTWDPSDPADVEKARKEVEDLKAAGYVFFAVVGSAGEDEIEAGGGRLLAEKVVAPVVTKPVSELKGAKPTPPRKGRRTVAVPPMAGG